MYAHIHGGVLMFAGQPERPTGARDVAAPGLVEGRGLSLFFQRYAQWEWRMKKMFVSLMVLASLWLCNGSSFQRDGSGSPCGSHF